MSPQTPHGYNNFSYFSCFKWPWQVVCRMFLNCDLSDVFLEIRLGCVFSRKETRDKVQFSSHHYQGYILSTCLTTVDSDFDKLTEILKEKNDQLNIIRIKNFALRKIILREWKDKLKNEDNIWKPQSNKEWVSRIYKELASSMMI